MMELVSVIIVALVVQQAVEAIKKAIKIKKGYSLFKLINVKVLLSIAISIVCISTYRYFSYARSWRSNSSSRLHLNWINC